MIHLIYLYWLIYWNCLKSSADGIVLRLHGHQLTVPYLMEHGFDVPILVEEKEGLEMLLPPENFTVQDVENYIGE